MAAKIYEDHGGVYRISRHDQSKRTTTTTTTTTPRPPPPRPAPPRPRQPPPTPPPTTSQTQYQKGQYIWRLRPDIKNMDTNPIRKLNLPEIGKEDLVTLYSNPKTRKRIDPDLLANAINSMCGKLCVGSL
ncbi:Hypothetical predicted protein [Drosophila guanche]|uniref:Uncharacterized protein n=1 Tax=Drosophila guanche TaxID=7266 RepID=A0A3B0IYS9_DROGU|nr:Hypothetical predicted protein [Drosophila guanche]